MKGTSVKVPSFMQDSIENIVNMTRQAPTFNTAESFEENELEIYQFTNNLDDAIV